ncbi:MAG: transcriptional regulator [Aigarchaeota archaeon]|nr:transcriptional regulator [Candidatus Pelearchaeum maunauluense]
MNRDQALGVIILLASIAGILIYGWIVFLTEFWQIILKLTAFVAVAGILGILAWIGYTLATTPPPKPIEEIEKELEEELKKTEQQQEKQEQ